MRNLKDRLKAFSRKWGRKSPSSPGSQALGHQAAQASPASVTLNLKSLQHDYLNRLISDCRPVFMNSFELPGIGPGSNLFLLDKLYVLADTFTKPEAKNSNGADHTQALSAIQAVAQETCQRLVMLGRPGIGKSTFLNYLALQHARALSSNEVDLNQLLPGWTEKPLLPVLISLFHLAKNLRPQALPDDPLIETYLASDERSEPYAPYLLEEIDRSGGLFLFDGLDEISDPHRHSQVLSVLQAFVARHSQHPATRFVVTCRTLSYEDPGWQLPGWSKHELAPLNHEKINQLITSLYAELIRIDSVHRIEYENLQDNLLARILPADPIQLLEFASIPLLANTLVTTQVENGGLPQVRAGIYQACLDQLITHWAIDSGQAAGKMNPRRLLNFLHISRSAFELLLQEIAYQAQANPPESTKGRPIPHGSTLISEKSLESILQSHLKSDELTKTLLTYMRQPNGVFTLYRISISKTEEPSPPAYTYGFIHPFLEGYLSARYLERRADLGFEAQNHLRQGSHWRNVLVLLGEILTSQDQNPRRINSILNALAPAPLPQEGLSPEAWRAVWMAGELLKTYRTAFPQHQHEHQHIPRGLVNLLQARGTSLPPAERAAAGDVLNALGDPRFRSDLWYLPDESLFGFIFIPGGPFYMGGDPLKDPAVKPSEQPQHTLKLPAYFMARNLVTVAQFTAFLQNSDYQPANPKCLAASSSHPVVYVAWYDALRYCEWLNGKLIEIASKRLLERALNETERFFWEGIANGSLVTTLPSEAEWEKAARGPLHQMKGDETLPSSEDHQDNAMIYPWGNEFNPNNANTIETGLGTTSPVGCFPMGSSPYGVLDMAGNVWEWTRTLWGNDFVQNSFFYPYTTLDGRENIQANDTIRRVIRGGSFFFHNWHTRSSARGRIPPADNDWDIGFRISVTPVKAGNPRGQGG